MTLEEHIAADFGTLPDLLRWHAQERGDHTALLLDDGSSLNYRDLDRDVDAAAAALAEAKLPPGAVAAFCAGTSLTYLVAMLGCLRAGLVVAPLAASAPPAHLDAMLANAEAALLFRDAAAATAWRLPPGSGCLCVALDNQPEAGQPWASWIRPGGQPPSITPQPDWAFNLIYSSGTTGVPKGIVHSWGMRWAHIQRGRNSGYGPDAVTLAGTPLYSNTTLVALLPTLALGGTVVLMRKFDARHYLALAERHRATHSMLVPVQYRRLMDCPEFDRTDLSSFRTKFSTGAPFDAALKAEVARRWPGALIESYGLTEGGGRCELRVDRHPDKLHTVGRPVKGHDIRLIDDKGQEVPAGQSGEVVGHSNAMMSAYHRLPDKTREAEWFDHTGKRFIRTGDVGRFDEDGFLVLGDRKKDMVLSGGFNIYPSDIEAVLRQHPAVHEAAVVGVPSRQWGETPVAYVVLREAAAAPDAEALRHWTNTRVGSTQRLAALVLTDRLPRSEIGKVLKRELSRQFVEDSRMQVA